MICASIKDASTPRIRNGRLLVQRCNVRIQGKLANVKRVNPNPGDPVGGTRGAIDQFSKASRLRLLKRIAIIDWDKLRDAWFVTLTYPDAYAKATIEQTTMHRHRWIRDTEKYLCEKTPMLWRKETIDRKSGKYKGLYVQHFHLVVFTGKELLEETVRTIWRKVLKVKGRLEVDSQKMDSGEHGAFYLAKYVAKVEETKALDYGAYLNSPGRPWGFHRDGLIPRCEAYSLLDLSEDRFQALLAAARRIWGDERFKGIESMTLLGKKADEFSAFVRNELS